MSLEKLLAFKNSADINDLANQIGNTFSEVQAVSNVFTLDLSENINFQLTLDDGVAKSFVFSNIPSDSGRIINITARIICTVESALNVPASVMWQNGIAPAYIAKNKYLLMFTSYDAGETWDGSWVGAWAMPPEIIVFDDFNRADNATSLGDAVTGQTWQYSAGAVWAISNNQAIQTGILGDAFAFINSGVSDCIIKTTFLDVTPEVSNICFRFTNASNHFFVARSDETNKEWFLAKLVDGNLVPLGYSDASTVHASGDVVKIVLNASSIKVYINDILVITAVDSFNSTATIHGLNTYGTQTSRFDDFSVEV